MTSREPRRSSASLAKDPSALPEWAGGLESWFHFIENKSGEKNPKYWSRIVRHWSTLDTAIWHPLLKRAEKSAQHCPVAMRQWGDSDGWREAVPAFVLKTGLTWALHLETRPKEVVDAAHRASELESKISKAAVELSELIRERRGLEEKFGVMTEWGGANLDIWQLIDRAAMDHPGWASVCDAERAAFLRVARTQSRPGPELEDVLREVRAVHPAIIEAVLRSDAGLIESIQGSSPEATSRRVKAYFRALNVNSIYKDGSLHGPLAWITAPSIATFLSVLAEDCGSVKFDADGNDSRKFSNRVVGDALRAYKKSDAESRRKLAP